MVRVGARVRVHSDEEELEYEIVEPAEADPGAGRLSSESPMGGALLGGVVGEMVTVRTPGGKRMVRIVAIVAAGSEVGR
jgi:transcription elongation GreA/GreB family factor